MNNSETAIPSGSIVYVFVIFGLLSLSLAGRCSASRRDDCIVLRVSGVTDAGAAIKEDLVRVLQNKLDDAVLEVLHGLLSRNAACKLTADDVHFIQVALTRGISIHQCLPCHGLAFSFNCHQWKPSIQVQFGIDKWASDFSP